MANGQWGRRFARWFKLRFAILYFLGIWAMITSYPTDKSIMRGIWFILLGLGIRSWANCYAIKLDKLTTSGPYAYVRHPLYLGSFLVMMGFLVILNINWIISLICVLVVIGTIYKWTIQKEEKMLLDKFGREYTEYCKSVPNLFPAFFPFKGGEKWGPSLERYFRSQEYKLTIWMIILVIVFHLKSEFFVEKENFDGKIIFFIIVAFLLGLLDLIGEIFQRRAKAILGQRELLNAGGK